MFFKHNATVHLGNAIMKLDLEKADEPEIKLQASIGSQQKQENSRNTSTSASLTMLKPLIVDHKKTVENP